MEYREWLEMSPEERQRLLDEEKAHQLEPEAGDCGIRLRPLPDEVLTRLDNDDE
jgi:hypothetical protein